MKRQWSEWMADSLPEPEPLKKWVVTVELYKTNQTAGGGSHMIGG